MYKDQQGLEHSALVKGDLSQGSPVVRLHSECLTGDAFGSLRCDCGPQLQKAMQLIGQQDNGAIIYLRQEGRGIGLLNKIKAYSLQDQGYDTVEANEHLGFDADLRDYSICKTMLDTLKVKHVEIMTNNPKKLNALREMGIDVIRRTPIDHGVTDANRNYLKTKTEKLGHTFNKDKLR